MSGPEEPALSNYIPAESNAPDPEDARLLALINHVRAISGRADATIERMIENPFLDAGEQYKIVLPGTAAYTFTILQDQNLATLDSVHIAGDSVKLPKVATVSLFHGLNHAVLNYIADRGIQTTEVNASLANGGNAWAGLPWEIKSEGHLTDLKVRLEMNFALAAKGGANNDLAAVQNIIENGTAETILCDIVALQGQSITQDGLGPNWRIALLNSGTSWTGVAPTEKLVQAIREKTGPDFPPG